MSVVCPDVDTSSEIKLLPPYAVVILNDDHHSFEFVVGVLMKVIKCKVEDAVNFAKTAHEQGRAIVWTGSKEVAELKKEQILTFHEQRADIGDIGPLGVDLEPV